MAADKLTLVTNSSHPKIKQPKFRQYLAKSEKFSFLFIVDFALSFTKIPFTDNFVIMLSQAELSFFLLAAFLKTF